MNSKFYYTICILILISFGYFATDIYLPSLPYIAEYYKASDGDAQKTLFSYLLSFGFSPLLFGPLSDILGRKKIIFFGLSLSFIATLLCIFAPTIKSLIFIRFVQGLGSGAVIIAARSMLPDLFKGKELATRISYVTMSVPIFLAAAPTIGGLLQGWFGWRSVFMFLSVYILSMVIFVIPMRETTENYEKTSLIYFIKKYLSILRNKPFIIASLGMAIPSMGLFAYMTTSSFIFQETLGLTPPQYGFLAVYMGSSVLFSGYLNTKLVQKYTLDFLILIGSLIITTSGILIIFVEIFDHRNFWTILLPCMLFFFCIAFNISNSMSKSMSFVTHSFGISTAFLSSTQFIIGSATSFIFSQIQDKTALPLGICFLGIGIVAFVIQCHQLFTTES